MKTLNQTDRVNGSVRGTASAYSRGVLTFLLLGLVFGVAHAPSATGGGHPLGYAIETPTNMVIRAGNAGWLDDPGKVLILDERSGEVAITISRTGYPSEKTSVHYQVASRSPSGREGSATAGLDFQPGDGWLTFDLNETNRTFTVQILNDTLVEGDEDFYISLDQGHGVPITTPEIHVFILDNEQNQVRVDPDFDPKWAISSFETALPVVQPSDGKILIATLAYRISGENGMMIMRLLPDGPPDPTWQPARVDGIITHLVPQTNGQWIIAAQAWSAIGFPPGGPDFTMNGLARRHLARLERNGALDPTFSVALPTNAVVTQLALEANGKILVGTTDFKDVSVTLALARLDPSGSRDSQFHPSAYPVAYIFPSPDGRIFLGHPYGGGVYCLRSDGEQDKTFAAPEDCGLVAVRTDGRLLVLTGTYPESELALLTRTGEWDPSFLRAPVGFNYDLTKIISTRNDKVWIVDKHFRLTRRNSDGTADPTWQTAYLGDFELLGIQGPSFGLQELADENVLLTTWAPWHINGQPRGGMARLLVNAALPRFEVAPDSAVIAETNGTVSVRILRCGSSAEPSRVNWRTEGGSARSGVDFVPGSGVLTFARDEATASLELVVLHNPSADRDRTVHLLFHDPAIGGQSYPAAVVTLKNKDFGFPPHGVQHLDNGRVLLTPVGMEGETTFEVSSDLKKWEGIDLYCDGPGSTWLDKSAEANRVRFYRMRRSDGGTR